MLDAKFFDAFSFGMSVDRAAEIDVIAIKSTCSAYKSKIIRWKGNVTFGNGQHINSFVAASFRDSFISRDNGVCGYRRNRAFGVALRHVDYLTSLLWCGRENKLWNCFLVTNKSFANESGVKKHVEGIFFTRRLTWYAYLAICKRVWQATPICWFLLALERSFVTKIIIRVTVKS